MQTITISATPTAARHLLKAIHDLGIQVSGLQHRTVIAQRNILEVAFTIQVPDWATAKRRINSLAGPIASYSYSYYEGR